VKEIQWPDGPLYRNRKTKPMPYACPPSLVDSGSDLCKVLIRDAGCDIPRILFGWRVLDLAALNEQSVLVLFVHIGKSADDVSG
jgi:hypothetical protein